MGIKSNLRLIEAYEYFTYGNLEKLKLNQMLKVTVSRWISDLRSNIALKYAVIASKYFFSFQKLTLTLF